MCVNENCKKVQKINEKSDKNRNSCGFLTPIKRLSWESQMIWYDIRVPKGTLCTEVRLAWQGLHKWVTFSIIYGDFQRILRLLRHGYGETGKGAEGTGHRADGQMERQLSCRGCVFRCTLQIAIIEGVGVTTRAPDRESSLSTAALGLHVLGYSRVAATPTRPRALHIVVVSVIICLAFHLTSL